MKIRVMYGESFVTICGYEDYIVDLDKFPELQGKSEEEITEWLYKNSDNLYINDSYEDPNPREEMGGAYEIVPEGEGEYTLADTVGNNGVTWDKIKNEEHYFVYVGEEAEETESEEENGEEEGEEKESS